MYYIMLREGLIRVPLTRGGHMAKVKCKVCANELNAFCKIKKVKVSLNKPRKCEAYVYDEAKLNLRKKLTLLE
jgi:hypothetical protein